MGSTLYSAPPSRQSGQVFSILNIPEVSTTNPAPLMLGYQLTTVVTGCHFCPIRGKPDFHPKSGGPTWAVICHQAGFLLVLLVGILLTLA